MTNIYAWPEDDGDATARELTAELRRRGIQQPAAPRGAGDLFAPVVDFFGGLGRGRTPVAGGGAPPTPPGGGWNRWSPTRLARIGGIGAGGLALGGVLAAASELANSDPTVTNAQKLGGAAAAGLGSAGLGALGATLGIPLGPAGVIALGTLGTVAGSQLGGLGRAAVGAFRPSELDRQIAAYTLTAQAQAQARAYEMQTLLPIQKQVAEAALANQVKGAAAMAPIEAERERNQTLYQGLLNGQQQQAQLANTALSGLYSGGFI